MYRGVALPAPLHTISNVSTMNLLLALSLAAGALALPTGNPARLDPHAPLLTAPRSCAP